MVRFKGYGPEDDLSIPLSECSGIKKLIKKFHELNPSELKPDDLQPNSPMPSSRKMSRRSSIYKREKHCYVPGLAGVPRDKRRQAWPHFNRIFYR